KAFQNLGFWFRHHLYTLILKAFPAFLDGYYYFFSLNWGINYKKETLQLNFSLKSEAINADK
ncbi:MAG: hypothetical protein SWH54_20300, partial [Thermodesulfobacteriota bacterium]|nr:hypothetical protein [Thermodesulfobacteriota bacterium]